MLWMCLVCVVVLCWIDHVWSSKECVCFVCDPNERLSAPSICFVCVFVCRKLSPHLGELTFEAHIEAKLGTANQMLGLIRRSLTCCTAEIDIPLYKAFVRQHLEFGVAVWGGFIKRRQLQAIERVQMRATKIVESVKGMPYEERLRKLKLPTMTYRRARGLMMEVWKHINSYDTAVISPTFQFTR